MAAYSHNQISAFLESCTLVRIVVVGQNAEHWSTGFSIFVHHLSVGIVFSGKIFLGGLPRNCTEETLTQYFTKFGEIMESTVVRDNVTGNSRGFGFIKFKDPDSVQTALAAGNHTIDGKSVSSSRCLY